MLSKPTKLPLSKPCKQSMRAVAVAAPVNASKASSNGGGPHRIPNVQASLEDINKALAACIKQAGDVKYIDKINLGIGKEISKAAMDRFGK